MAAEREQCLAEVTRRGREPLDGGLGLNSSNFRQVFLEFSGERWGSIKIGRDLGVFGSDAILSDMTLSGVGTSMTPATSVGTANGMSTIVESRSRPGNGTRTKM